MQLPVALETHHFYSIEGANERPVESGSAAMGVAPTIAKEIRFGEEKTASTIGSLCERVHDEVLGREPKKNLEYEETIMRAIRADVFKGLRDDPMAQLHLGSKLRTGPDADLTLGPRGEEVRYIGVRTFPSGSIVGLFGVWPGWGHSVYGVVVDEKFPEFFGLYYRALEDAATARLAWDSLVRFEHLRNEELGSALIADGWTELLPRRVTPLGAG